MHGRSSYLELSYYYDPLDLESIISSPFLHQYLSLVKSLHSVQTVFIRDSPTAVAVNTGEKKKSVYLLRVRTRLVVILTLPQYSGGWLSGSGRHRACSVNDMLTTPGWPSLKHRRSKARLVNFYEFHHWRQSPPTGRRARHAHSISHTQYPNAVQTTETSHHPTPQHNHGLQ